MPDCSGCGQTFIGRGFTSHLAKTTNPACVAAREAVENNISDSDSEPEQEKFGQDAAGEFPTGGGRFQGDFFGNNYNDTDFGYISDPEADIDDEEDNDDSEDPVAEDRQAAAAAQAANGWEPDRPLHPGSGDAYMEDVATPAPAPERPSPSRETL
jgi:hypothetical protein